MADTQFPAPSRRGFDLTFNLGHVIIIVCGIAGLIGSHYLSDYRLGVIEKQNTVMQAKLDGFSTLLIDAAVAAQRMRELERRLEFVERR